MRRPSASVATPFQFCSDCKFYSFLSTDEWTCPHVVAPSSFPLLSFFFFRQVDFHGRQLDLWINITVFVCFFENPHKKNCCEHSWKMFSNDRLHAPIPVRYSRHTYQKKRGTILKCLIPGPRPFSLQRLTSFIFYLFFFFRAQTHRPPPPSNLFSIFS